jgi:D-glycero-alpha-D-manno-heptose-7-phosphate kinase
VDPVICTPKAKQKLGKHMILFYTGITRKASKILTKQIKNTKKKAENLKKMVNLSEDVRDYIHDENFEGVGNCLHQGWLLKKELASSISNPIINKYYEKARKAGAWGGKILGAGGGGFLMVFCEPKKQAKVKSALKDLKWLSIKLEPQGSKIIYVEDTERVS